MSNEMTVNKTISALYQEILRLEVELEMNNNYIFNLQVSDDKLRTGFKKFAYHLDYCKSHFTKEWIDCDCGLKDFVDENNIK